MIHHLHLHRSQTVINLIDQVISHPWYDYVDILALGAVCLLSIKLRSVVAFVVLADFILVYFGQNWLRSLSIWGSLGLDYHYTLGIKDALMALLLFSLAASPWLTLSYIIPSMLCWGLWGSYSLLEYEQFLKFYYAWSPLYALAMFLQIYGLSVGDSDAGRRVRRGLIRIDWSGIFQPLNSIVYARITLDHFKNQESN